MVNQSSFAGPNQPDPESRSFIDVDCPQPRDRRIAPARRERRSTRSDKIGQFGWSSSHANIEDGNSGLDQCFPGRSIKQTSRQVAANEGFISQRLPGEWLDHLAIQTHRQMHMRKFRGAGRTDRSDTFALSNLHARANGQAAVLKMAVLRGKAALVIDHHSVATLPISQAEAIIRGVKNLIRYTVPNSRYRSVRDGSYRNVLGNIAERSQTDVPPVMSLIGRLTAQRIHCAGPRINVRHLLNKAVKPPFAIDRQPQAHLLFSFGERWKRSVANNSDANCEGDMIQETRGAPVRQTMSGRRCGKFLPNATILVARDQDLRLAHGKKKSSGAGTKTSPLKRSAMSSAFCGSRKHKKIQSR